jgi:hypothetical protein
MNKTTIMTVRFRFTLVSFLLFLLLIPVDGQDNKGNPLPHFLFPKFEEGEIVMKDGSVLNTLINYNMVDEMMVTEVEGTYRYSKNPSLIESITIQGRHFIPKGKVFYEILYNGKVTFFLQNKATYIPIANEVGYGVRNQSVGPTRMQRVELTNVVYQYGEVAYLDLPQEVEVKRVPVYWVSMGDMMEQFTSEKQFIKLFPEYESELKEFIKKSKIKIKNPADVVRLGKFCDEIMK